MPRDLSNKILLSQKCTDSLEISHSGKKIDQMNMSNERINKAKFYIWQPPTIPNIGVIHKNAFLFVKA